MTNEVSTIYQKIVNIGAYAVEVVSNNGRFYKVKLSDRVRLTMEVEAGDIAVIKTFEDGWLVTDLEKVEHLGEYDTDFETEDACVDLIDKLKVRRKNLIRETKLKILLLEEEIDKEQLKELERQKKAYDDLVGGY